MNLAVISGLTLLMGFLYNEASSYIFNRFTSFLKTVILSSFYFPPQTLSLEYLRSFLSDLFVIVVFILAFFLIMMFIVKMKAEEGIVILPFDMFALEEKKYSGTAISDLLISELQRIRNISDEFNNPPKGPKKEILAPIQEDSGLKLIREETIFHLENILPERETLDSLANMGTVAMGSTSLSIGQVLITFKKLCPWVDPIGIITGSIQMYGETICMIARFERRGIRTWKVSGNINEVQIPSLVRDMAFKIADYLSKGDETLHRASETWLGLKYLTESQDSYLRYVASGEMDDLECAQEKGILAQKSLQGYKSPLYLLSTLGFAYIDKKMYLEAERLFHFIGEMERDKGAFGFGILYYNKKCYDKSLNCFDKATNINRNFEEAWFNKGVVLDKMHKHDEAIKAFGESIRIDKTCHRCWNGKGLAFYHKGYYNEAVKCFDESTKLYWKYAKAWYNKGKALDSQGKYDEAIKAFDKAIEIEPQDADAWHNKGNAFKSLGLTTKANAAFAKARDLGYNS